MVKISVADLKMAIQLIEKCSTDMHIAVRVSHSDAISLSFMSVDGQHMSVELWNESTANFAKVHSSERLGEVLQRYKK